MRKLLFMAPMSLLLAACANPPEICDRELQTWDKFQTEEDQCNGTSNHVYRSDPDRSDSGRTHNPGTESGSTDPDHESNHDDGGSNPDSPSDDESDESGDDNGGDSDHDGGSDSPGSGGTDD